MSTLTKRPSGDTRTPQESPTAIAREIAALACAPTESFGAFICDDYNDDRGKLFTRLAEPHTDDDSSIARGVGVSVAATIEAVPAGGYPGRAGIGHAPQSFAKAAS